MPQMSRKSKVLLSVLLVGLLGAVAGMGVFSAFSSTTTSPNNTFSAGSVTLTDNDSNAALYSVSNRKPGDTVTSCIKVTYTGTLAADVHIYTLNTINAFGQYIDLTITPGTQSSSTFPSCTGFTPDAGGAIYTGTLLNFGTTKNSYANGVVDYPGAGSSWVTNDAVVYQFTVTMQAATPDTQQGATTGLHDFKWEARNQ
jgi:predicted ribosomally synthesized peptide with SipW-like signal peptide